jgi:hypothetical protein
MPIQAWTRLILFANTFCKSAFGKSLCTYKRCWKWCPRASIQAWAKSTCCSLSAQRLSESTAFPFFGYSLIRSDNLCASLLVLTVESVSCWIIKNINTSCQGFYLVRPVVWISFHCPMVPQRNCKLIKGKETSWCWPDVLLVNKPERSYPHTPDWKIISHWLHNPLDLLCECTQYSYI